MIPYSSQESIKRITEVVTVTEVTVFLEGVKCFLGTYGL